MNLHIDTLLTVYGVLVWVAALALGVVVGLRGSVAVTCAQVSAVLHALGWTCLLVSGQFRGQWQDRALSGLAMLLLSQGLVVVVQAVRNWRGRSALGLQFHAAAVVMPVLYTVGFDSYPFRVGLCNLVLGLQMFWIAAEAIRPGPTGGWRWRSLLAGAMLLVGAMTLMRAGLGAFFTELYPAFRTPHPVNQAALLLSCAASMLTAMALLAAHREEAESQLHRLAVTDGLTEVYNRRSWNERAEVLLADARRYGHPLILLMLDLDHFKRINDERGHTVGDRALQLVARVLREELRSGDLVGRYGGEEFCVLLSHTRESAALVFDQRLRQQLRQRSQEELGFVLEYSAGLSSHRLKDRTLEDLLRRADAALYEAKRAGRNQLVMAP